jgi:hypothetical protein
VGLTGLEPVTLRLSSACSNQLSYRPRSAAEPPDFRFTIADVRFGKSRAQARIFKISNRQSAIRNSFVRLRQGYGATAPKVFGAGGKGIRTPDFQLAKLALYQLSYAPRGTIADCRLRTAECKRALPEASRRDMATENGKCRMAIFPIAIQHSGASSNGQSCVRALRKAAPISPFVIAP